MGRGAAWGGATGPGTAEGVTMTPFEQLYTLIPVIGIALTGLFGWLALRYLDRQVVVEKAAHPAE